MLQVTDPIFSSPKCEVSKKVSHAPVRQKLRDEIDFLERGCFQPRTVPWWPADQTLPPKITCGELDCSWKLNQYPFIFSKVMQLFNLYRHIGIQTHRCTSSHRYTNNWKNFNALFDTFHFTVFIFLTPFVKDKYSLMLVS